MNGKATTRLVLDTGADLTLIAPDVLRSAGGAFRGYATVRGVTGQETVEVYEVASLEVGFYAKVGPLKVFAHAVADRTADGLLGRDFLEHFTVTIDSEREFVLLTPKPQPRTRTPR